MLPVGKSDREGHVLSTLLLSAGAIVGPGGCAGATSRACVCLTPFAFSSVVSALALASMASRCRSHDHRLGSTGRPSTSWDGFSSDCGGECLHIRGQPIASLPSQAIGLIVALFCPGRASVAMPGSGNPHLAQFFSFRDKKLINGFFVPRFSSRPLLATGLHDVWRRSAAT